LSSRTELHGSAPMSLPYETDDMGMGTLSPDHGRPQAAAGNDVAPDAEIFY
jgi:hypothetical protein